VIGLVQTPPTAPPDAPSLPETDDKDPLVLLLVLNNPKKGSGWGWWIALGLLLLVIAGCGGEDLGNAPDVRGLALPEAKQRLERANYRTSVKAEDALFGVIVEENFTVCDQHEPNGRLVPLDVAKHGC
jgi:hypothetical protein